MPYCSKLKMLSGEILDVSRLETGNFALRKERFYIEDIIDELAEEFEGQKDIKKKDIRITYAFDEKLTERKARIFADKDRLLQVLRNLLDNAIKFSEKNGIISVNVSQISNGIAKQTKHYHKEHILISVRDSGFGIEPEIISKLFEKFVTKSEKGIGLGLFISKSIVEAHGGSMWAKNNEDGTGATFYFTIPL